MRSKGRSLQPQARAGRAAALVLGDDGGAEVLVSPNGAASPPRHALPPLPLADAANAAMLAQAVEQALAECGAADWPLALVLPSSWCLAAAVDGSGLRSGGAANRREALLYRLEEELPLAAEEMVADFLMPMAASGAHRAGGLLLGVATATDRVQPLVKALEARQLSVPWVIPEAIALLQEIWGAATAADADAIALPLRDRVEVFLFRDGRIAQWYTAAPEADAILRGLRLHAVALERRPRLALGDTIAGPWLQDVREECSVIALGEDHAAAAPEPTILAAVERWASGQAEPWINLRRDALGIGDRWRPWRRPWGRMLAALMVLALSVVVSCLWRGYHYAKAADADEARQQAQYRQAYPNRPLPPDLRLHLEREHQRLRGLSGSAAVMAEQQSALLMAYDTLRRLPLETRFRLIELRFGPQDFVLEGQGRSHGDADLIATALRKQRGFVVDPPRTEQLSSGGVGFIVSGRSPPQTAPPGAKGR